MSIGDSRKIKNKNSTLEIKENNNEIWEEDDEREDKDHWVETAAGRY